MFSHGSTWRPILIVGVTALHLTTGLALVIAASNAEKTGPRSSHPVAVALWHVRNYDIYDCPVMIRSDSSLKTESTVTLLAEEKNEQMRPAADWRIEVIVPLDNRSKPRVKAQGSIRRVATGSEKYRLALAVIEAMDRLEDERLLAPNIPGVLQAIQREDYYAVYLSRLPRIPGGDFGVRLSRDLKNYHILRGH
jgi:hypothetical protein